MYCPSCGADAEDSSRYCPACGATLLRSAEGGDEYVGKTIASKYRVEALIGEGGMGKVYRARQLALDKVVVLKVLRHTLLSDERTVARFQREAKAASRLNHPNSISVLDFGQADDGALFIAMEYVAGQDLHQILSREWPLGEARVVRIALQILSALSDAHGAGVIHRDLKPENIMVEQRRNEPDFVKVLDFGIAKITDSQDEGPALTRAGFVCGTPEYMSPEQARGAVLDHRSDLYAVGVILYQLTTGLLPFESDSAVGFATKHLTEEPPPPTRRRPDARISPGMERLILRVLSKDPDDRPANAGAFKTELLAVDKERRRGGASASASETGGRRPQASGVLAPIPRKSQAAQNASRNDTGWNDVTVEATVQGLPHSRTPVSEESTLASDGTRTSVAAPASSGGDGIILFFKALTTVLVLGAVGFFVYYFGIGAGSGSEGGQYVAPPNAPRLLTAGSDQPEYLRQIPSNARNVDKARKLTLDGDRDVLAGELTRATSSYKEAFLYNPEAELALKLGELYWQRDNTDEARGWWVRHLTDMPDSRARAYIEVRLGSPVARPSAP
ncbi:serine/threonine-protein kinase [Corallococcus carmarthensis]|uniref:non-specific serine/threonine protein kinase n=1 Tax=Corallococcus carmarthensis TaxID=2316728 RepID=A0A3A8K8B5_9BACT|nr:serine/threonine-protein kinase [Corallococcus carmarthensis]NOK22026.1 protein kinase [Corallococcus carmarthensis]RKH03439.1 serine/threonine protein kinase [Corallococcus carmarthensis]